MKLDFLRMLFATAYLLLLCTYFHLKQKWIFMTDAKKNNVLGITNLLMIFADGRNFGGKVLKVDYPK